MKRKILSLLAVSFIAVSNSASADIKPFLQGGYDFGGDKLIIAQYVSGKEQKITAGAGLNIEAGAVISPSSLFEAQLSLGYKIDNAEASNGNIKFKRTYASAIGSYNLGKGSIGAGITYHLSPKLTGAGVADSLNTEFENTLGGVVQAGYKINKQSTAGLRATIIEYEYSKTKKKVDGNSIGLFYIYKFSL